MTLGDRLAKVELKVAAFASRLPGRLQASAFHPLMKDTGDEI
jgi:hypothetical protein